MALLYQLDLIDFADPKLWIISAIAIVIITFLLIYLKLFLGEYRKIRRD